MLRQSSARNRPRRWLVFTLLALLALAAALVGGGVLWQRLHAPAYRHTPNAINTGASILYLSSPSFAAEPTLLTMVRTRDGATLWHYPLAGTLSTGTTPTIGEALASGQAVAIADGVIYFVVDPDHLGSPDREQELMALRADDGAVLWRQPVRGAIVDVYGVSDGVVCLRIIQQQGSRVVSAALAGYDARTGALAWQRQGSDVAGSQGISYGVYLLDGILYVTGGAATGAASSSPAPLLRALLSTTGQTLWQYAPPPTPNAQSGPLVAYLVRPVAAEGGVVVVYAPVAGASGAPQTGLIGMRERDGAVVWRYEASNIYATVPHGGANGPGILEQGGALYFGATAADTSLQLTSLQVTTGRLLWHQTISAPNIVLWDLAVGGGSVYAVTVPQWQGLHPGFGGLVLSALDARTGALRWQDRPAGAVFPYVAAAGDVVVFTSASGLAGVSAGDGSTLWRQPLTQSPAVSATADTAIVSSVISSGPETWAATLCGVQRATGTTRWCDQFATGLAAVVLGP